MLVDVLIGSKQNAHQCCQYIYVLLYLLATNTANCNKKEFSIHHAMMCDCAQGVSQALRKCQKNNIIDIHFWI